MRFREYVREFAPYAGYAAILAGAGAGLGHAGITPRDVLNLIRDRPEAHVVQEPPSQEPFAQASPADSYRMPQTQPSTRPVQTVAPSSTLPASRPATNPANTPKNTLPLKSPATQPAKPPSMPPLKRTDSPKTAYAAFPRTREIPTIVGTAERVGVDVSLLLAIRMAENGRDGLQFGVIPTEAYDRSTGYRLNGVRVPYGSKLEKQASWSAHTIMNARKRYDALGPAEKEIYIDFIDFLGDSYCPVGAPNDPKGLNGNWEGNVRRYQNMLKAGELEAGGSHVGYFNRDADSFLGMGASSLALYS